ncbi:MAG: hypothetical protein ACQESB_00820, partial [Elusimicrobiota bacterium]
KEIDRSFYNSINAVDSNYRNDIILYINDLRLVLPPEEEMSVRVIKRYINIFRELSESSREAASMDFRFLAGSDEELKGSVIVGR